MNSAGDGKNLPGTIFPWFLAEDNPVISPCEEITLNKTRERRPYSAGDKLPKSTGDQLQGLLGIWILNLLGVSFEGYQDIQLFF